ncbi:MAG TPA: VWA domain-containing protein [Vicinamibacterales bacterium]|nr:VWA domain-containing protein [Vicinamibacterales bacterium]
MNRVPVLLTLAAASITSAMPAAAPVAGAQAQRFTTGVEVVRVDALVTNGKRPVAGLGPGDFDLRDNGVLQTVTGVSRERLPLNVICALDVSGSVGGAPILQLKEATARLFDALASDDRAALVTFSERLQIHSRLTGDRAALRAVLADIAAGGATALFDAMFASLALRETDDGRTVLLVFSDGLDTASWLTAKKVLEASRRTDVVIYPITARRPVASLFSADGRVRLNPAAAQTASASARGEKLLDRFAEETGGRVFQATAGSLRSAFIEILDEFRQRYVLTYTPTGVAQPGWHSLDVRLRGRSGEIKARRGYFAS